MIDPKLLKAYNDTRFIVYKPDGEIVLRVGEQNAELDDLMNGFRAMSCAFITACNPGSVRLADTENADREDELIAETRRRGWQFLYGRGVGEDRNWPPEDSILIIGMSRVDAMEIGRLFGQLCVVYAEREAPVELLLCED